jgi:hypothetical protein
MQILWKVSINNKLYHFSDWFEIIRYVISYWYSVKSSWELVFIVIQKPNSNKVFVNGKKSNKKNKKSELLTITFRISKK